ncbi:MAG TPA: xanthine dehydrogenase family protein subunit M [Roseiflexaceae bacterium]|nr:xanthine dehydrogenase family protein subunit M [Roseiflexaceae bacterium]
MRSFDYLAATTLSEALDALADRPGARPLGGGTNLVDLARHGIEAPDLLVDITRLAELATISELPGGGLRIGAGVRNTALAAHPLLRTRYPAVAQAVVMGASGQLRNMATVGGNLMQRTRCLYFYDPESPCNKRTPGAGCGAIGGFNRTGAIFGASAACVAVHPSDLCVALAAFDAVVELRSRHGMRRVPLAEFHRLPGETPHLETSIAPEELITAVELPALPVAAHSRYRKIRDRASYAFALVSVAAAVEIVDGMLADVRLALGGVAHRPWRATRAEELLRGGPATPDAFAAAAEAELAAAEPSPGSEFKVELARQAMVATLNSLKDNR